MIVPEVLEYQEISLFLKDFLQVNKELNTKYSVRFFSNRLRWPTSLFNDVISSRKSLSLKRAIEFSNFLDFDDFKTEYFVMLVLKTNKSKEVSHFFTKYLNLNNDFKLFKSNIPSILFSESKLLAVFDFLEMKKVFIDVESTVSGLSFFKITHDEVESIIDYLQKNQIIKIKDNKVEILNSPFYKDDIGAATDNTGMLIHTSYSKNLIEFLESPKRPFTLNSGYIPLSEENYKVSLNRILALRNLIFDYSKEDLSKDLDKLRLYQIDLNLFPLTE